MNYIANLPGSLPKKNAKDIVTQTFSITGASFYYYYNKVKESNINLSQILDDLDGKGCTIHI
jgi:hypothetical protein